MIDYRLKTFLELCKCMNYRKTAEKLNITQPAVTQHIHLLEEEYNCKFFLYDRKKLTKTKEAKVFEKYARTLHYNDKNIREKLRFKENKELRIGATKSIGQFVIPEHIIKAIELKEIKIEVYIDNTERLLKMIDEGVLDFALIEGHFDKNEYDFILYSEEEFVGACSINHRFANKSISLEEVFSETLILREKGSGTRNIFEEMLKEKNHTIEKFDNIIGISDFTLINKIIARDLGISFLYKAVIANEKDVAQFRISNYKIMREFNYVYLKNSNAIDKILKFKEICGS